MRSDVEFKAGEVIDLPQWLIGQDIWTDETQVTPQMIFDRVVAGYKASPARCPATGPARYRCPDEKKCFGGYLIDDDHYHPSMEGKSFKELTFEALPVWMQEPKNFDLALTLQRIHDNVSNWTEGRIDMLLALVAHEKKLNK